MLQETSENDRERESRGRRTQGEGFRLTHKPGETEEIQRETEHKVVKVDCFTLCFDIISDTSLNN